MKNASSVLSFILATLYFASTVLAATIPDVSSMSEPASIPISILLVQHYSNTKQIKSWDTINPCKFLPILKRCKAPPNVTANVTAISGDDSSGVSSKPTSLQIRSSDWCEHIIGCCYAMFGRDCKKDDKSSKLDEADGFDAWIRPKGSLIWFPFSTRDGKVKLNGKV